MEQAKEFKSEFQIAQKNRKENMRIEKNIRKGEPVSLIKRLFFSKKYNNDLVERLADGDLTIAQMKQIKIAWRNCSRCENRPNRNSGDGRRFGSILRGQADSLYQSQHLYGLFDGTPLGVCCLDEQSLLRADCRLDILAV